MTLNHDMGAERHHEQKAEAVANANTTSAALQDPSKHFSILKFFSKTSLKTGL